MTPSIWTGMFPEEPLEDALRVLAECGWQTFEISTEHLEMIENHADPEGCIARAAAAARGLNLSLLQAHALLKADIAAPDEGDRRRDIGRVMRHIGIAAALGCRDVVVHAGGRGGYTTRVEEARISQLNVEAFREIGDYAAARGTRICIENLSRRGVCTAGDMHRLLDAIDHPAMAVVFDSSHAHMAHLDLPAFIRDIGARLAATHLSDNNGTGDQHLNPGGGTIDWPGVMQALRSIDYQGLVNLENPGVRHADRAVRILNTRFARQAVEWLINEAGR